MIRLLVLLHRYLGIGMCMLFATWFSSGIVMVFVPYPELRPAERFRGLMPLASDHCCVDVAIAFARTSLTEPPRQVRLTMVGARPVFHFHPWEGKVSSVYADTGELLGIVDAKLAVEVATRFAPGQRPTHAALEDYDQWTVPNRWNAYRPFHRIALNDEAHTELYVSANSGEVVRATTRRERGWNWIGSVMHWIYPTVLRKHPVAWDSVVWWLSLAGIVSAVTGVALGLLRFRFKRRLAGAKRSPYHGWMYWHHVLGLTCAVFVLSWILSGWLSMDHARLFSDGAPSRTQKEHIAGGPLALDAVRRNVREAIRIRHVDGDRVKEVEVTQLAGTPIYELRYDAGGVLNFVFLNLLGLVELCFEANHKLAHGLFPVCNRHRPSLADVAQR